jgi:hypothetical protein
VPAMLSAICVVWMPSFISSHAVSREPWRKGRVSSAKTCSFLPESMADRIAANGDVANKIGTYSVAVLAKEHGIPFYVAAPWSTVDMNMPDGEGIPIEQRSAQEVTHHAGKQVAPDGVLVENPAFDMTPSKYIASIITERGIANAPYADSLRELAQAVPDLAATRR